MTLTLDVTPQPTYHLDGWCQGQRTCLQARGVPIHWPHLWGWPTYISQFSMLNESCVSYKPYRWPTPFYSAPCVRDSDCPALHVYFALFACMVMMALVCSHIMKSYAALRWGMSRVYNSEKESIKQLSSILCAVSVWKVP